ncbi:hypothetical protein [Sutterella sp.]|uniref:hypothetical protein n=1 Tax=Sutterella sp. TaxID=1981025 RepID=UPI0026E0CEDE|nr:hypothetical protein [Sutterella sp.]MDO5531131.1 hypothetical protein [Sutterella sp.]
MIAQKLIEYFLPLPKDSRASFRKILTKSLRNARGGFRVDNFSKGSPVLKYVSQGLARGTFPGQEEILCKFAEPGSKEARKLRDELQDKFDKLRESQPEESPEFMRELCFQAAKACPDLRRFLIFTKWSDNPGLFNPDGSLAKDGLEFFRLLRKDGIFDIEDALKEACLGSPEEEAGEAAGAETADAPAASVETEAAAPAESETGAAEPAAADPAAVPAEAEPSIEAPAPASQAEAAAPEAAEVPAAPAAAPAAPEASAPEAAPAAQSEPAEPAVAAPAEPAAAVASNDLHVIAGDPTRADAVEFPPLRPGCERWVGYLRRNDPFNNFFITGKWSGWNFIQLSPAELRERFPSRGSVTLNSLPRKDLRENALYVVDLDSNVSNGTDLQRNFTAGAPRTDFEFGADYQDLVRKSQIHSAADFRVWLVVFPVDGEVDFGRMIYVRYARNEALSAPIPGAAGIPVLLAHKGNYYGPWTLYEDSSHRPYVKAQTGSNDGIVQGFSGRGAKLQRVETSVRSEGDAWKDTEICLLDASALKQQDFDVYSDDALLRHFAEAAGAGGTERKHIKDWIERVSDYTKLFSSRPEVRAARVERLKRIFAHECISEEAYDDVSRLVWKTVERSQLTEGKFFEAVAQSYARDPKLLGRISSYRAVQQQCEREKKKSREDREKAERICQELRERSKRLDADIKARETEARQRLEEKTAALKAQKAALEAEVAELAEKAAGCRNYLEGYSREVEAIDGKLKKAVENASDYAFDGAISAKLLEAAAAWTADRDAADIRARVEAVNSIPLSKLAGADLRDYLVRSVRETRNYSTNDILNLWISLAQNFLTVFSGPPGSGKTSICRILARSLGLTGLAAAIPGKAGLWRSPEDIDRFISVTVERGWTSKRDFLGYWNPLTKTFECPDPARWEAFGQLDAEARANVKVLPEIMLLDEANLSPMEYYWADFMSVCDERGPLTTISLGDRRRSAIPDTLRFLATMNSDHTTEALSPRLIDRTSIITLPETGSIDLAAEESKATPVEIVSWKNFTDLFDPQNRTGLPEDLYGVREVADIFGELGSPLSARAQRATVRYMNAALRVFEATDEQQPGAAAADFVVSQRLLPLVNGTGEKYGDTLARLLETAEKLRLIRTAEHLKKIIADGEQSMDCYNFF